MSVKPISLIKLRRGILLALMLTVALCSAAISAYAADTVTQAEDMWKSPSNAGSAFSDSSASGGRALALYRNGKASRQLSIPNITTVVVRAKGDQCNGGPRMVVAVDSSTILTTTVTATSWTDYRATVNIGSGTRTLSISFTNDYYSGCDRNLRLDKITFVAASTTTTTATTTTTTPTTTTSTTTTTTTAAPEPSTTTSTPESTTTLPAGQPSGQPMPLGDLPDWRQIFTDDFTTDVPIGSFPSAVSTKWWAYPEGWKDTSKNGSYYPSKVMSIGAGVLNYYIHTENGIHMVSAPVPKLPNIPNGQLYGRYAVRFKSDPIPGYKTAWLLWPDSEIWPRDGEIDFPEGHLNGTILAYVHHQGGTWAKDEEAFSTDQTFTSWHTAVIEWKPNSVTFLLDNKVIGVSTTRIPNTPMHWVLQTETVIDGSTPPSGSAGNVQIDWVAVYKYVPH